MSDRHFHCTHESASLPTIVEEVPFGEDRTATYEVPDTVPSGTYRVPGFFGARWGTGREGYQSDIELHPFEITLRVA